ncbi:Hypothetical predicted protein [Mytilus galloprovincialis]|uniref:Tetraspanin n=1 Tax=Mytilus galloprovincialis TaxID=29158 RepID=A0A8B6ENU4_MYTGA|nr:Hypothetical predicted protein [Mytilus galloprovincialis]
MMGIYIKVGDDILEDDVIKVVNMQEISGMPLGTMVKAIVFSLIGVFVLELLTGVVGIWGAFGRRKQMLAIMVGGGLLGLGLTLMGDNFIYDSSLKYIFYQIQFYNYYFYDILVGLAASSVVFGILAMVISIIGIVGSWRKSSAFLITSSVLSTILHVPRLISLIVFSVLIQKIKNDMKDQLYIQQNGYYYNNTQNKLTENWNNMIMKCCGVFWFSDTSFGGIYEYQFCCKNAHESRMDAGSYYTTSPNNLDYFGSCGGYKRDNVGLWCFMTVANLVQIGLWKEFMSQAKCCGVSTEVFALFGTSNWRYQADSNSQYIPVQCCKSQTEVYPYGSEYDFNCTHSLLSGYYHDQGCDTAIINRLESYSIPFFVFISIAITAQIGIIATTIFYEFIMATRDNAIGAKVDTSSENIELKELKESEKS